MLLITHWNNNPFGIWLFSIFSSEDILHNLFVCHAIIIDRHSDHEERIAL